MIMKQGLYLHTYISQFSGETIYLVYDSVGAVFQTIFPHKLEPYLAR
jgi:hypothetical protein